MLEVNNGDLKDCGDGHGVYATLARPGSRAMSWLYPSTGLSEVLLARSSQRGVLGTAPGQSSQFLLVLTGLPEQPLNVCTSLGCVHSP